MALFCHVFVGTLARCLPSHCVDFALYVFAVCYWPACVDLVLSVSAGTEPQLYDVHFSPGDGAVGCSEEYDEVGDVIGYRHRSSWLLPAI